MVKNIFAYADRLASVTLQKGEETFGLQVKIRLTRELIESFAASERNQITKRVMRFLSLVEFVSLKTRRTASTE